MWPQKAPKAYLHCRSSGTSQFLPGQFLVISVYRDGVTRSTMHCTDSFRHLVYRREKQYVQFFLSLFYFLLIIVCASWVAFCNARNVFYRKPFLYVFRTIWRAKPDFTWIRICFSLLYYCTFNNKPSFWWKITSFLRSVPYQNMLFYFKSFGFVASLVALYHAIVKLLAVKLTSASDLLYFLQVTGQFSIFLPLW